MLTFIIPLKSKKVSDDWQAVLRSLGYTLDSIANQTSSDWRVIIACHDIPEIDIPFDGKVIITQVDFGVPKAPENLDTKHKVLRTRILSIDKFRKVRVAAQQLHTYRTDFVMLLDADDLISSHLCEFANDNVDKNGWYVSQGYVWTEGSKYILKVGSHFYQRCGSSAIIKIDYNLLPNEIPLDVDATTLTLIKVDFPLVDYGHRKIDMGMKKAGTPLEPLPFPGAIYVKATENISTLSLKISNTFKLSPMKFMRTIKNTRPLTQEIVNDFAIPTNI
jgi:hypothetical protein